MAFLSPAPWLSWLALALALALMGPFGTYTHCTLFQRFVCFATMVGLCLIWGVTLRVAIQNFMPELNYWEAVLSVIAASTVLLPGPAVWMTPRLTFIRPEDLPNHAEMAAMVAVFGIGAAAVRWSISGDTRDGQTKPVAPNGRRLADRLSAEVQGKVMRVTGRNHYVEVLTERGEERILLRLSDAIAELDAGGGLQVHRSHWVAADAVVGSRKVGPKYELVLKDGSRVPVSRNYVEAVAARGLI